MARLLALFFCLLSIILIASAESQEISGPEVNISNNDIYVTFSLNFDPEQLRQIKDGIDKDLKLNVDLFKIWKIWPDEFVSGKVLRRTLKSDPIKGEYVASSLSGNVLVEKRFRSVDSMIEWSRSVSNIKLANTRELEPGRYFVRVTAESKIRKLPPVITYFFIFLSENEFKVRKDSAVFTVESKR